jgi:hypothetical protein
MHFKKMCKAMGCIPKYNNDKTNCRINTTSEEEERREEKRREEKRRC